MTTHEAFYSMLVMLAIVTSLLAGSWLERVPRDRPVEPHEPSTRPRPGRAPARGPLIRIVRMPLTPRPG